MCNHSFPKRRGGIHKPYGGREGQPYEQFTILALLSKSVHEGGRYSKISKNLSTWFMDGSRASVGRLGWVSVKFYVENHRISSKNKDSVTKLIITFTSNGLMIHYHRDRSAGGEVNSRIWTVSRNSDNQSSAYYDHKKVWRKVNFKEGLVEVRFPMITWNSIVSSSYFTYDFVGNLRILNFN